VPTVVTGYEVCHCVSFEGYILVMLSLILVAWLDDRKLSTSPRMIEI
jgi:hypothetical protein